MGSQPTAILSCLPSIDRLLNQADAAQLISDYGRNEVKRVARLCLERMRQAIRRGEEIDISIAAIFSSMQQSLASRDGPGLRRVFNLTGTVIHTNLGRSPMPRCSIDAVTEVMADATNLEYDLESGSRGDRDGHLCDRICRLSGAEAATIVNNNAAAVMLVLNTLAFGKEVPVSRGELVEIGGSFRIPDIMARSGCKLREVGTTNRTHLQDYQSAINAQTAMIMKVHQSNYVIEGFTASVEENRLAGLCADSNIPLVVDLGSRTLIDLQTYGLPPEPTATQTLKNGADLVTFSGDKLLGGPQAGIIVGRGDLIRQLNANPMKRALRCDKMTIAALSALLKLYCHPDQLAEQLPVLKMMTRSRDVIQSIAAAIAGPLQQRFDSVAEVTLIECDSEIGSGALPDKLLPSYGVAISPQNKKLTDQHLSLIARAFRQLAVPVIGRINRGKFILDCRTLEDVETFVDQLVLLEIDL